MCQIWMLNVCCLWFVGIKAFVSHSIQKPFRPKEAFSLKIMWSQRKSHQRMAALLHHQLAGAGCSVAGCSAAVACGCAGAVCSPQMAGYL